MAPSYWFSWVWWLPLMLAITEAQRQGEGCSGSPKRCGNLTISHPFWLMDLQMGGSCGPQDFEVTCINSTPVLLSSMPTSVGFTIMNISYEENSLRVVDLGKLSLLAASNSCNKPIWNTSEKLGIPFRIDPVNLSLLMYNCTAVAAGQDRELVETRLRCGNESQVFARTEGSYDETSAIQGCDAVVLPVLGGANGKANASDYEQLITNGFILRWDSPPPLPRSGKLTH